VESNGDVRNRVAEGRFDLGLTDTDDVFSALDRNKPVGYRVVGQTRARPEAFLVPNTVSILRGAPHPTEARAFVDYLLRPETERWLSEQGARQIPVRPSVSNTAVPAPLRGLRAMEIDAAALAESVLPVGERVYRILSGEEP
jgi:iron(III) transport system substrate-binding protein